MLPALIQTMRPRQWTKNILFVFPAIVFDAKLLESGLLLRVLAACGLLILLSGSVYIINDLCDLESDRAHPKKRHRPLPSGRLPIPFAVAAAVLISLIALLLAFALDFGLCLLLGAYLLLQMAYSLVLKHCALLDVLAVAAGFVLRVMAGGVVIAVPISPWLYSFAGLLALFLVIAKRRQELFALGAAAADARPIFKQYSLPLLDEMLRIVSTATLITYILYTIEVETMTIDGINFGLLTVPMILYGLFRYLYLIHIENDERAPDEVLLSDRPLQMAMLLAGLILFVILYFL